MSDAAPRPSRRALLAGGTGVLAAGAAGWTWQRSRRPPTHIPLYAETVAFAGPTERVLVPVDRASDVISGTRVLRSASDASRLRAEQDAWLDVAPDWVRSPQWADLARSAALDIWVLSRGLPAPVAGWSPKWRYVWPRDASSVAVALARIGHRDEAISALTWLQQRQDSAGWFEARYDPHTGKRPDDRERQLDGSGWVLWAADRVIRAWPAAERATQARKLDDLVTRSVARITQSLRTSDGLPVPSPDYWEVDEDEVTLGTVAPLAAGLESATRLLPLIGRDPRPARTALDRLDAAIARSFGAHGWPRHAGGHDPDIAVAMLLPPFRDRVDQKVLGAVRAVIPRLTRPAGGLAPGTGWHDDKISWTPETALVAAALAASGDRPGATRLLDWLQYHRTAAGSLPEKVLGDGSPAAVAPLSWTAALALLAIAEPGMG